MPAATAKEVFTFSPHRPKPLTQAAAYRLENGSRRKSRARTAVEEASMAKRRAVVSGLAGLALLGGGVAVQAHDHGRSATGLVREVREGTAAFRDVTTAMLAGYGSSGSCVSGPDEGAMGIHYPNGGLIGDGALDAAHPEILIYEQKAGRLRLVGAEFLVLYDAWHASHDGPPILMGQHFNYAGSPNRYGLPAYYQLHVWAWRDNPKGPFANWNPRVSCAEYEGE
jgi:hypothetical protein